MRVLFKILPYHVVGEKGFSTSRRAKDKFVPVGDNPFFHWQIGNIHMQWFPGKPVNHFNPERRR